MSQKNIINSESKGQGRNSARSAEKAKQRRESIAIRISLCVCGVIFVVGGLIAGKALIENSRADQVYDELRSQIQENTYTYSVSAAALTVPIDAPALEESNSVMRTSAMDFAPLKEVNSEIVAWLACEGTVIDYPVMRADDNDFYLDHLYTKESNRMGSLFMDCRNTGLFTDKSTVIYGHNMKSGAMFNTLSEYKAQDYYDAFPTLTLYTPDGDYEIELFAGTVEDGNFEFVKFDFSDDKAFMAYIDAFRVRSTFETDVKVAPTDKIVTLCTCSYERSNARYIVMGKLVPIV